MIDKIADYLRTLEVSQETLPSDPMNNGPPFYYETGRSALRSLLTALTARLGYIGGDQPIKAVLDFGCGYGRITRWIRAAFPDATISVNDLNKGAAQWCAEHFQASAVEDPLATGHYDLIFLGSVFTHIPPDALGQLFHRLIAALTPNGVLVFTTMGRYGCLQAKESPDARINRGIDKERMITAFNDYQRTGFGFVPNSKTPEYGSAWTSPLWFHTHFGDDDETLQIMFQEKGWDNFQDVYAYMKAPLGQRARSRM